MCDPLPVLEKRFETELDGLFILVDNEEIKSHLVNNVLKINVKNNTIVEIIGFTFASSAKNVWIKPITSQK